jgi:hypothetical protein
LRTLTAQLPLLAPDGELKLILVPSGGGFTLDAAVLANPAPALHALVFGDSGMTDLFDDQGLGDHASVDDLQLTGSITISTDAPATFSAMLVAAIDRNGDGKLEADPDPAKNELYTADVSFAHQSTRTLQAADLMTSAEALSYYAPAKEHAMGYAVALVITGAGAPDAVDIDADALGLSGTAVVSLP